MLGELNNKTIGNSTLFNTKLIAEYWRTLADKKKLEDRDWWRLFYAHHRQLFYISYNLSRCADWDYLKGEQPNPDSSVEIVINVERAKPLLKQLWLTSSTLILQSNLQRFNGEYHLLQAQNEAKACAEYLESQANHATNWYDLTETIVIDALAKNQINITCINGLCDLINIPFKDLCNIDDI